MTSLDLVAVQPEIVTNFPDAVGGSPTYDATNRRLLWVDTNKGLVHELTWDDESALGRTWYVGSWAASVAPTADGGFVVATNRDIVTVSADAEGVLLASQVKTLASLPNGPRQRWRHLRCDSSGRLIGAWVVDDHTGPGGLVRIEADGSLLPLVPDVGLLGGCDWSPDGSTFYVGDSHSRSVDALDYDSGSGAVGNRRRLLEIEPTAGVPIGLAVDHEGCLWVVILWSGEVRRYSPEGELLASIPLPTTSPTACGFGGPDGADLFVTSMSLKHPRAFFERAGLPEEQMNAVLRDELGGALLSCRPGVSGPAATLFAV